MSLLVFVIIVVVVAFLAAAAAGHLITKDPYGRITQGLILVVAALIIASRAGLV